MCSYITKTAALKDSAGKGAAGWMEVDTARVYYDHPYYSRLDHVVGVDITCEAKGGNERIALELSAESARALVQAILDALENGEREHGEPLGRPAGDHVHDHDHQHGHHHHHHHETA
jgi:hypothetical protein